MEQKSNKLLIGLLVGALFIVGLGGAYYVGKISTELKMIRNQGENTTSEEQPQKSREELGREVKPLNENDQVYGNREADVVVYEYSDIECPYCATQHATNSEVIKEYSDRVAWVYRHFPLDSKHPNARRAAIAAECVSDLTNQETFFTFLDVLFENQSSITATFIREEALTFVGNEEAYTACVESEEIASKVQNDLDSGIKAGIRGTPGTIIYNAKTDEILVAPGVVDPEPLRNAIESLL